MSEQIEYTQLKEEYDNELKEISYKVSRTMFNFEMLKGNESEIKNIAHDIRNFSLQLKSIAERIENENVERLIDLEETKENIVRQ